MAKGLYSLSSGGNYRSLADGGSWRQANANSRATYAALTALGYSARFVPSDSKGKYSIEPESDA